MFPSVTLIPAETDMDTKPFWKKTVRMVLKKTTNHYKDVPVSSYQYVCKAFEKKGGSWEKLASGDPESWTLLRDVCKGFLKVLKKRNLPPYDNKDEK